MKAYKLTPLERLKLEEKKLHEDLRLSEQKLLFQFQYIGDNWGSITLKSITSSFMNRAGAITHVSPVSTSTGIARTIGSNIGNIFLSNYKLLGTVGWKMIKPMALPVAISFITKKATSRLFGKKRKK